MLAVTLKNIDDLMHSIGVPTCTLEHTGDDDNPSMWEFYPTTLQYCISQHCQEIWLDASSIENMRDQYRLLIRMGYTLVS